MKIKELLCDGLRNNLAVAGSQPEFSYLFEDDGSPCYQEARRITVRCLQTGTMLWDSQWISDPKTWGIVYEGAPLEEAGQYEFQVESRLKDGTCLTAASRFETALIHHSDLPADWIGHGPLFRTEFDIKEMPVFAKIAVTGLGYYELFVNGERVGDNVLAPSYTWYEKRIEYQYFDLRDYLHPGKNAVGISLGAHWKQSPDFTEDYCYQKGCYYSGPLKTKAFLDIRYEDGSRQQVKTNDQWRCFEGPVVYSSIYDGEYYDARRRQEGFSEAGFDDRQWDHVNVLENTEARLVCSSLPPIRVVRNIAPVSVTQLACGDYVVDFGVNIAGCCTIRIDEPDGQIVTIRHAELLSPDGTINPRNLRWAKACDTYVSAGEPEVYEPRFTYHGFRYVQVSGVKQLTTEDIYAREIHSHVTEIGEFSCSDSLLNQLHDCMRRTITNNLHSIPTDCCQRDERQGWMADGQLINEAAIANFDMQYFYRKWLEDIADTQDAQTGNLPYLTAPAWIGGEALAWTCAYYEIVYSLYRFYDDRQTVKRHYNGLQRYFNYLKTREGANGLLTLSGLCDWLAPEPTEEPNIRDALYYRFARIMGQLSEVLGYPEETAQYTAKADQIRSAYNQKYYSPHLFTDKSSGYYGDCYYVGQTANALPLSFGIPDEKDRERIKEKLLYELTESMGGLHLTTGFIGTKALFEVLSDNGYDDLAWDLLHQDSYPSYGFMLQRGATTIWERWQYRTDNDMNSHCHPPLAAPDTWFYRVAAGLRGHHIRKDGICEFLISPATLPLNWVKARQQTRFGEISVELQKKQQEEILRLCIPANTEALVCFGQQTYYLKNGTYELTRSI